MVNIANIISVISLSHKCVLTEIWGIIWHISIRGMKWNEIEKMKKDKNDWE